MITHPNPQAPLIVSYGAGVDSTAMLVAFKRAGIIPDLVMFADTGGEKPETYRYLDKIEPWLREWAGIGITRVRYNTTAATSYDDLPGNCHDNETLPSLAFGMHSCSVKWKINPQEYYVQGWGQKRGGPNKQPGWQPALDAWARGINPIKCIGYDNGKADKRRAGKVHGKVHDKKLKTYDFWYPLQDLGWARPECIQAIQEEGLDVPMKSACYFCPASKKWELWWLVAHHPDLFLDACLLEYNALTGKHSRWDAIEWGNWESHLATGQEFPSTSHCGLGRSFSWCKWAYDEGILDVDNLSIRPDITDHALAMYEELHAQDNAADVRGCSAMEAQAEPVRIVA